MTYLCDILFRLVDPKDAPDLLCGVPGQIKFKSYSRCSKEVKFIWKTIYNELRYYCCVSVVAFQRILPQISLPIHYRMTRSMTSQITSVSIICATICSGLDERKQQMSASLAFVRGIHPWFPTQRASNTEKIPIWWRHNVQIISFVRILTELLATDQVPSHHHNTCWPHPPAFCHGQSKY